jgi:hypothetical protein
MHSGYLGLGVYREFIGYLMETGLLSYKGKSKVQEFYGAFPELSPRIFTTATARVIHGKIPTEYGFRVEDDIP